jgi:pimeloyl-ACP methyl ester carboxylesterase
MPEQAFVATTEAGPIAGSVSGTGPPLLLLHGGPGLSDYLDMLGPEVDGWRSIRYQQRGVAPSTAQGPFTVQRHVADATAVLDQVQVERAVLLGHSWGGHLALQVAVARPDRVAGLVIVDPLGAVGDGGVADLGQNLGGRLLPAAAARYGAVAARLAGPDPTDADGLESLALLWPGYFADPATAPPIPPHLRMSLAAYVGTSAAVAEHLAAGFGDQLSKVAGPAVFVLGERSPMPPSQGRQTAALLPDAEVRVIPGAGHLPWYEQPGCVAAALADLARQADDG